MKLNLGVVELGYADKGSVTTGDVAKKLEKKYSVMQNFYNLHDKEVVGFLEQDLVGALENLLMGSKNVNLFKDSENQIEELFKFTFLEQEEMAKLGVKGVPTYASLKRRSLRFKSKIAKKGRPSFIDTGLYEKSFKAWIDT